MKKQFLFDNTPFEVTDELRKEYEDCCGIEGTDEEVYGFFVDKFNDLFESFQYARDKKGERICDVPVIITGKLDTWNGRHTIKPLVAKNIENAVCICCEDAYYATICKEFSKITIEAVHHDGTNVFTVQFLNNIGETRHLEDADVDLTNRRYIRTLGKFLF